jgi:magnesium transporter
MPESESDHLKRARLTVQLLRPSIVGRIVNRVHKAPGAAPGTLQHTGSRKVDEVRIQLIDYDANRLEERTLTSIEECFTLAEEPPVTWVNVDGLHDVGIVEAVGQRFDVHRLALEDVLSTKQRPKVEEYEDHFLVIVKMLSFDPASESIRTEQLSLIVGPSYLFSFQEQKGDVFEPIRERLRHAKGRIRSRGTDYLAYALVDTIVDSYFRILEEVGDRIEVLEETVLGEPSLDVLHRIHHLRREMLILRRAVWPLREALGQMYRGEVPHVTEETRVFLRDVYDHSVQVIDTVETLREVLSGAMDLHMSGVGNRMNEVMKVLTIIATIFIPLSFFAGVYGMNFEYMPELGYRWAYPTVLGGMALIAGGMLVYFKKKDWL